MDTHSPTEALDKPGHSSSRERVLSDGELQVVWQAAEALGGNFGGIVKLLILTGQRRTEIGSLKAEWCPLPSSKDGDRSFSAAPLALGGENIVAATSYIWFPGEYTKNKRLHQFPTGDLPTAILRDAINPRTNTPSEPSVYIFPAKGKPNKPFSGWSKAKKQLDKKIADILNPDVNQKSLSLTHWTLHDLRRTYVTNLQRLHIPLEVREALINHISGASKSGVAGVYNRYEYWDEMCEAVETYERWFKATILQVEEL